MTYRPHPTPNGTKPPVDKTMRRIANGEEDELYFDPRSGELRVGSPNDTPDPDAVPATQMVREGFFALNAPDGLAIVHPDVPVEQEGPVMARFVDGDTLIFGGPDGPGRIPGRVCLTQTEGPPDVEEQGDLAVLCIAADTANHAHAAWIRQADTWRALPIDGETIAGETLARNRTILETAMLQDRTVAIVGLGSGGATIALELAKAGVGHLILIDRDRIEATNVGRHVCDLADLGRRKTAAVAERVARKHPEARIDTYDLDVLEQQDDLQRLVASCDVLVAATDSEASRRVLHRVGREAQVPMIFGRAYRRACGGDVMRIRPGDGPCYACLLEDFVVSSEVSRAGQDNTPAYSDRPAVVEPGLALDIAPIAHMCARMTLIELVRGTDTALASLEEDLPGHFFLWANRREHEFANWKPGRFSVRGLAVQRWYAVKTHARSGCAVCDEAAYLASLEAELDLAV